MRVETQMPCYYHVLGNQGDLAPVGFRIHSIHNQYLIMYNPVSSFAVFPPVTRSQVTVTGL